MKKVLKSNISKKKEALKKVKEVMQSAEESTKNLSPKRLGTSKEDIQNVIDVSERPIRRNSAEQIISYSLPTDKEGNLIVSKGNSVTKYGRVLLPGTRTDLDSTQYKRVLDNDIEQFTRKEPPVNLAITKENKIFFPSEDIESIVDDTLKLKFNGELIRVGSGPDTFYYIEEGKFYTFAPSQSYLMNIIAERLGVPMTFRINSEYDYENDINLQWGAKSDKLSSSKSDRVQLDMGQNQYRIYDTQTYLRASIAYVESNTYGGELTKEVILGIAAEETVYLRVTNQIGLDKFKKIRIYGNDCTPIVYNYAADRPIREAFTSTENDIYIEHRLPAVVYNALGISAPQIIISIELHYYGQPKVSLNPSRQRGSSSDTFKYRISKSYLTANLSRIYIKESSAFEPFYVPGGLNGAMRFDERSQSAGSGAPLYKWTAGAGGNWNLNVSDFNTKPLTVDGSFYQWNGTFYETYVAPPGPIGDIMLNYPMLDGNLIALYKDSGKMRGGDKLVQDLYQAALLAIGEDKLLKGKSKTAKQSTWSEKIKSRSSGKDETKLLTTLIATADDINLGGDGYLGGNPFANVNLNFQPDNLDSDPIINYDDLTNNLELLIYNNSMIPNTNGASRRDLKQAWEKGDGSAAFGGKIVRASEKLKNRALKNRRASVWKACIKKRAGGREEQTLFRLLGHTSRAVIKSGNGRIQ